MTQVSNIALGLMISDLVVSVVGIDSYGENS